MFLKLKYVHQFKLLAKDEKKIPLTVANPLLISTAVCRRRPLHPPEAATAADLLAAAAVWGPNRVNHLKKRQAVVTRHSGTAPGGGNTELSDPGKGP